MHGPASGQPATREVQRECGGARGWAVAQACCVRAPAYRKHAGTSALPAATGSSGVAARGRTGVVPVKLHSGQCCICMAAVPARSPLVAVDAEQTAPAGSKPPIDAKACDTLGASASASIATNASAQA